MKEELKKELKVLINEFVNVTEYLRTSFSSNHDIPTISEPTFSDFIEWLNEK